MYVIRLVLTPIRAAALLSWAVARIIRPVSVLARKMKSEPPRTPAMQKARRNG